MIFLIQGLVLILCKHLQNDETLNTIFGDRVGR